MYARLENSCSLARTITTFQTKQINHQNNHTQYCGLYLYDMNDL